MKELAKLEELRQEMEKGLDGLGLFMETWECCFALTGAGNTRIISPLDAISTEQERESMNRILESGGTFLAGMKLALDVQAEYLKREANRADAEGSGA